MINPNELRIGNLVEWVFPNTKPKGSRTEWIEEREIVKIESIRQELVGLKGSAYGWHQIQGIPITEEWLLKFGFKAQIGFIKLIRKPFQDCSLEISHNDTDKWYCYFRNFNKGQLDDFVILRNDLKYVHQLQNLYFALTQSELEIIKE